ncbi:hypothetical protein SAMN05444672_12248 [Bacillus sp. OK838]|nr:hypothetical protein SAMN05444672_12248 [Bacillus sp. OK838]
MNFETKYLIRWGIPGWIFIVGILPIMFLSGVFNSKLFGEFKAFHFITLIISLITIGIPIGYIFQRSFFMSAWIRKGKKVHELEMEVINKYTKDVPKPDWWGKKKDIQNYFFIEYQYQYNISKLNNDRMTYLSQRYAHLLSTTHSMGTVTEVTLISCGIYLAFTCYAFLFGALFIIENAWFIFLCCSILNGFLGFVFLKNFRYFSANALFFQVNLLNDIYKENNDNQSKTTI